MSKVRGWLVILGSVALTVNEGLAAGAGQVAKEASSGPEFALPLGLGMLALITAGMFRRRRGRN